MEKVGRQWPPSSSLNRESLIILLLQLIPQNTSYKELLLKGFKQKSEIIKAGL